MGPKKNELVSLSKGGYALDLRGGTELGFTHQGDKFTEKWSVVTLQVLSMLYIILELRKNETRQALQRCYPEGRHMEEGVSLYKTLNFQLVALQLTRYETFDLCFGKDFVQCNSQNDNKVSC